MTTTYTLSGAVVGPLWWPIGAPAAKSIDFTWQRRTFGTLPDAVAALMAQEDGDYSGPCRLTADSLLVVTRHGPHGQTHTHSIPVTDLPSIREDVDADSWGADFFGEDD